MANTIGMITDCHKTKQCLALRESPIILIEFSLFSTICIVYLTKVTVFEFYNKRLMSVV
jgi:hypothetical protein